MVSNCLAEGTDCLLASTNNNNNINNNNELAISFFDAIQVFQTSVFSGNTILTCRMY